MKIQNNLSLAKAFQTEEPAINTIDASFAALLFKLDLKSLPEIPLSIEGQLDTLEPTSPEAETACPLDSLDEFTPPAQMRFESLQFKEKSNIEETPSPLSGLKIFSPSITSWVITPWLHSTEPETLFSPSKIEETIESNLNLSSQPMHQEFNQDISSLAKDVLRLTHQSLDFIHSLDTQDKTPNSQSEEKSLQPIEEMSLNTRPHALEEQVEDIQHQILENLSDFFHQLTELKEESSSPTVKPLNAENQDSKAFKEFSLNISKISEIGSSAKLHLHPDKLGSIKAEICIDKGVAKLSLSTEDRALEHLIGKNLQALRDSFQELNLPLVSIRQEPWQESDSKRAPLPLAQTKPKAPERKAKEVKVSSSLIIDTYA